MAFMKDILTRNIPIWEECAATPFVQEVQTGKLPLEKFKRYMIQDSIYLKNYARIYGKAIFHADTLREIQLFNSVLHMRRKSYCTRQRRIILTNWESKSSPLSNLSERNTPIFWNKNGKPMFLKHRG